MKNWLSLVALVVLCLALVVGIACGGGEEEEGGVKELKYGVAVPLSGVYGSVVGIPGKYAWSMAAEDIGVFTVGGEQYQWKLIFENNEASAEGGIATTMKFIHDDNVDFMHQSQAACAMAAAPICEEAGIILTGSGLNPEHITPDTPHLFQPSTAWAINLPPVFDWLSKEHPEVQRVAVAVTEGETGEAVSATINACADYYGFEVVTTEHLPTSATEYYPVATKIMGKDPDLVCSPSPRFNALLWEMGYEGLDFSWLWFPGYADQVGWDKCQGYLIGMPHPYCGVYPEGEDLVRAVEERYGETMPVIILHGAAALYQITDAMKKAGTVDDMDKIIETLETATLDTLVGPMKFGGEVLNGVGHVAIWTSPIFEVVGEDEYSLITVYSVEETMAIVEAVWAGK